MPEIMRLRDTVNLTLSPEFLSADDPRGLSELSGESDMETVDCAADIMALDTLIGEVMETSERYDTAMDAAMAVRLHRALPLTRRQAADRRIWAWLGIVKYPNFVAYRWAPKKPDADGLRVRAENRFQGNSVRQAFARLWWSAELTVAEVGDYSLTVKLLALAGFQDAYEAMFGRAFCQYRPGLAAFIDVVGSRPAAVIRDVAKEFSYLLTTEVLEVTPEERLKLTLEELVSAVEARIST